jgi:AcrR family transcriptional regulator
MTPVKAASRRRGRPSRGVREAILAAVRDLIREQGLAAVTTGAVAERAGAAEGSIHYHFGGKEQLLVEAIKSVLASLNAGTPGAPAPGRSQSGGSLLQIVSALESAYDELIPILVAIQSDPDLRRAIAPQLGLDDLGPHRAVALVARHVAAARASGEALVTGDDDALALLLVGGCFLRAWEHQASTHRPRALPGLARAVAVLRRTAGDDG